jgi:hypothetical protein
MSRPPTPANLGIPAQASNELARVSAKTNGNGAAPHRKVTTDEYITGYRELQVIDTPMRKLSVLESRLDGTVWLRYTSYEQTRVGVTFIPGLNYHEVTALAAALASLQAPDERQQSLALAPEKTTNVDIRKAGRA